MLVRVLLALGLALACSARCRAALGELDLPGELSATPLAQRLRLNGLPLEIQILASPMGPRQACELIMERWAKSQHAALLGCRQSGDWFLASACVGTQEVTVQLRRASSGSRGYLSQLDLRSRPARKPVPRVPLPPGAQVRNVLQSSGPEGDTLQFTVAMPMPPPVALRRLAGYAARNGWRAAAPTQPSTEGATFELRRGNELARGLLTRDSGGSGLVLVESAAVRYRP